MLFHHVLSIFGNIFVLYRNINGTEMMATLFGTEITNPVLQLRWFLRYGSGVGAYPPVVLALVDFVFVALFTLMRIVLASMLLNRYLNHPRPDYIARFFAITIYLVGWGFWLLLLRYVFRKYIKRFFVEKKSPVDSVPASSAGSGDSTGDKD
jgi:TLC domain